MTRQLKSASDRRQSRILTPLVQTSRLSSELIRRIKTEISTGRLTPGARLPTEQAMMESMGVSRTVVREAVSALRAQGFVVTRQGSGAFVSDAPTSQGFVVSSELASTIDAIIEVLELRRALEVDAVQLATERATRRALQSIKTAHQTFVAALDGGSSATEEDFAFHLAIAEAAGNSQFPGFLHYLGKVVIPRQRLAVLGATFHLKADVLASIRADHCAIADAIAARDGERGANAMRAHLTRSIARYRALGKARGDI
jgi:GntR family transcriptional regulator, transcriptional repressor for pyruvate dehydrogenase complex